MDPRSRGRTVSSMPCGRWTHAMQTGESSTLTRRDTSRQRVDFWSNDFGEVRDHALHRYRSGFESCTRCARRIGGVAKPYGTRATAPRIRIVRRIVFLRHPACS